MVRESEAEDMSLYVRSDHINRDKKGEILLISGLAWGVGQGGEGQGNSVEKLRGWLGKYISFTI